MRLRAAAAQRKVGGRCHGVRHCDYDVAVAHPSFVGPWDRHIDLTFPAVGTVARPALWTVARVHLSVVGVVGSFGADAAHFVEQQPTFVLRLSSRYDSLGQLSLGS